MWDERHSFVPEGGFRQCSRLWFWECTSRVKLKGREVGGTWTVGRQNHSFGAQGPRMPMKEMCRRNQPGPRELLQKQSSRR